jgi:hypothetical protein
MKYSLFDVKAHLQQENAKEYFKNLGIEAAKTNIGVDLFCGGSSNFCTPILHTLTLPSGGALLLLHDFDSASVQQNLLSALHRCMYHSFSSFFYIHSVVLVIEIMCIVKV